MTNISLDELKKAVRDDMRKCGMDILEAAYHSSGRSATHLLSETSNGQNKMVAVRLSIMCDLLDHRAVTDSDFRDEVINMLKKQFDDYDDD